MRRCRNLGFIDGRGQAGAAGFTPAFAAGFAARLLSIGALAPGTVMGITLFWLLIYGGFMVMSFLPETYPTPERLLGRLKFVLRGEYDPSLLTQAGTGALLLSVAGAAIGMVGFSRKDV